MPDCNLPSVDQSRSARENLDLQGLLQWAAKEFGPQDLFLLEAGSNSFEL